MFGESISQTNQFITSEVAEVGFTAKSVVLSPNMKENDNWIEMNINSYRPIAQGVVILKNIEMIIERKLISFMIFYYLKRLVKY